MNAQEKAFYDICDFLAGDIPGNVHIAEAFIIAADAMVNPYWRESHDYALAYDVADK